MDNFTNPNVFGQSCDFLQQQGWSFGWTYIDEEKTGQKCWQVVALKGGVRLIEKNPVLGDALRALQMKIVEMN